MKSIVLTGGGTAGHCLPHFALIKELKKHFDKIYYIGSTSGIEKSIAEKHSIPYYSIPTVKLKRKFTLENLKIPFAFKKSVKKAEEILREIKPSVIFSKGGFVGLPVTIAGKKLKIPVIIHESDRSLGLANKIAKRFAKKVLTTFSETATTLSSGEYVGAIINSELFTGDKREILNEFGFDFSKKTLLITGGSQGAKAINEQVFSILDKLLKKFNVLHITGKNNLPAFSKNGYKAVEFIDMKKAYTASDLCVSRAGSNTLFELIALKIPTLFIPLPKTESRGDQIENAEYFHQKGLSEILYQQDINALYDRIISLNEKSNLLKQKLSAYETIIANDKIIKILTSV